MKWTLGVLSCLFRCFLILLAWSALLAGNFCVWLLVQPQRIRYDLCFSEFSSFHGWLDWRGFHPDSCTNWRGLPVHHSRHPLSGADYSQTVAPSPVGARVFPCSEVSFGQYFASGFVLDLAWSGEYGLGWEKFFVFSFSGVGSCCQLATHANWALALVVSGQVVPVGASCQWQSRANFRVCENWDFFPKYFTSVSFPSGLFTVWA